MALSVSDHVGVPPSKFARTGAFDAVLDVDSLLFIDPLLLRKTRVPEFKGSYAKIEQRFKDVGKLLALSNGTVNDPFWKQAERLFRFSEVQGLCVGYSSKGTGGAGMGPGLRAAVLSTGKAIIDAGVKDPEIFELMGLFQEKVGPDRISDMIARIIIDDIAAYTQRVLDRLSVTTEPLPFERMTIASVKNPFNNRPILLVPRSVLRDLPIAHSWDEIGDVVAFNETLRAELNRLLGGAWSASKLWKLSKADLRDFVVRHPEFLREFVKAYREAVPKEYDFDRDPVGEVVWYRASKDAAVQFPLSLALPAQPTPADVLNVVLTICKHFKQLLENNGLNTLLYDGGKPKHESAAQKLFFGVADAYCEANKLDLSRESNAGRGPVDFKVSHGYANRVVVETKLSTNGRLLHGLTKQIGEYQKAEKSTTAVYVVIDVGGSRNQLNRLQSEIKARQKAGARLPEFALVDARIRPSASKL